MELEYPAPLPTLLWKPGNRDEQAGDSANHLTALSQWMSMKGKVSRSWVGVK